MSLIRRNTFANFAGNAWIAVLSLVSVPLVINILGIESYGLVAFFSTLLATLSVLDFGLSAATNRAAAQMSSDPARFSDLHDLMRTVEVIFVGIGVLAGGLIVAFAPAIAARWLNPDAASTETATLAVQMMGVTIALRWPLPLYHAGLMGLEAQVKSNLLRVAYETVRLAGALLCISLYEPTIVAFLGWQAASSLLFLPLAAWILRRSLPPCATRPRIRRSALRGTLRFAAGIGGVTLTGAVLMQVDKLTLSALLPLDRFGEYALASAAALTLFQFASPVSAAVFPRFAALAADVRPGASQSLRVLYHQAAQSVAFLVVPAALTAAFHAEDILWAWLGDRELAARAAPLLSILVVGNALNCLMLVPYALQVSHGWISLALRMNLASLALMPLLVVLGMELAGPAGAAGAWLMLNAAYVLVVVPLMHRRLLPGDVRRWYLSDTLPPTAAALAVAVATAWAAPAFESSLLVVGWVAVSYAAMVAAAGVATPVVRQWAVARLTGALKT